MPGEIALPENLTGNQFIEMMTRLRGMKDLAYTHKLMEQFELEPSGSLKRMSLGMKRKLAIVTAFMHDPDVLVLDEPTSGLDPIMQHRFIDFILQEKKRGKTILLSSHIFNEIDATCDKISMIKDGHIIASFIADELRNSSVKTYKVELISDEQFSRLYQKANGEAAIEILKADADKKQVIVRVDGSSINALIALLAEVDMKFFSEIKFTLEDYFMRFYDRNLHETEVISS